MFALRSLFPVFLSTLFSPLEAKLLLTTENRTTFWWRALVLTRAQNALSSPYFYEGWKWFSFPNRPLQIQFKKKQKRIISLVKLVLTCA